MKQWYYSQNGGQTGPIDESALVALLDSGSLPADVFVWCEGMEDWRPAREIDHLMTDSVALPTDANRTTPGMKVGAGETFQRADSVPADLSAFGWYVDALKQYAVFQGRARRKAYWMFWLFDVLFTFLTTIVDVFVFGTPAEDYGPFCSVYTIATIIPAIAVSVRRMHDNGRSGWWILCPIMNIVYLFTDSQPRDNEYGPNPKGM